jgi:hypothetical protein
LPFEQAVAPFSGRLLGHQQISDAFLLGLAIHRKGVLVTLDRGIQTLLSEKSPERARLLLL